jgi:hypothetical protein
VLEAIKSGVYSKQVAAVRSEPDKKKRDQKKKQLSAVTFSGEFAQRKADGLTKHSGFLTLDFDDVPDIDGAKKSLSTDEFVYAVFISPSGNGLKCLVRIDGERHRESFTQLSAHFKERHGLTADPSGKDVSRLCFVSHDAELYLNENSKTFIAIDEPQTPVPLAPVGRLQSPPSSDKTQMQRDARFALEAAVKRLQSARNGTRHSTNTKVSTLVGGYVAGGFIDEFEATAALEKIIQSIFEPESRAEELRTMRECIAHGKKQPISHEQWLQNRADFFAGQTAASSTVKSSEERATVTPLHALDGLQSKELIDANPVAIVEHGVIKYGGFEGRGDERHFGYQSLCNFAAIIRREVSSTDGVETQFAFEIDGFLASGEPLPKARVLASEFAAMNWLTREWGSRVIVKPTQSAKDKLRAAIQYLSIDGVQSACIYRHLGFAKIDNKNVFLHAAGGVGATSPVEVEAGKFLESFTLANPADVTAQQSITQTVDVLTGVAPDAIVMPMLLGICHALIDEPRYALYIAGTTGSRKTSLALVFQSFFGHHTAPPLTWEATANAIEGTLFVAKNCALVIDDYAPQGNPSQKNELQAKAARIIRTLGNGTGRARMKSDLSIVPPKPPRCLAIITGEDLPAGHSIRARSLILELEKADVNLSRLTDAQVAARDGLFVAFTRTFIAYVAPQLAELKAQIERRTEELRPTFSAAHGRTTDATAALYAVAEIFTEFAATHGAALDGFTERAMNALQAVAAAQRAMHEDADPTKRFFDLLAACVEGGYAHLRDSKDDSQPDAEQARFCGWREERHGEHLVMKPQGVCIGWLNEGDLFLNPELAYSAVAEMSRRQGDTFTMSKITLLKRLAEKGLIRKNNAGKNTISQRIAGSVKKVLVCVGGLSTLKGVTGVTGVTEGSETAILSEKEPF